MRLPTILEHAEDIGCFLYPVHRFILKLLYGLPLSCSEGITLRDHTGKEYGYTSEVEYLKKLQHEARVSHVLPKASPGTLVLVTGRRSGVTSLEACIASYAVRCLAETTWSQSRYSLPAGTPVYIGCYSDNRENTQTLFDRVENYCEDLEGLNLQGVTQRGLQYSTKVDVKTKHPASVRVRAAAATVNTERSSRGSLHYCSILDNFAFYERSRLYDTLAPTHAMFTPKDRKGIVKGPIESKVVLAGIPRGKMGTFYRLFRAGVESVVMSRHLLALQIPTWEMNPDFNASVLRQLYEEDAPRFWVEYGAQFTSLLD